MSPAISVQGLSKKYQIGLREQAHQTFREAVTSAVSSPLRRFRRLAGQHQTEEEFWALRDVSFDVQPGEVVGIIGHNGAGKSTLLKILSKITEPTAGRIEINGRVASLLEVGTGFHPELTGRENVFLNGAVLGMNRAEIKAKFDEIVAFAEVEKFLDTPVKRYSSGMQVRLAFAVAAHLDPEILIVDEVLAVGDAKFQQKCLGKMQDVATGGRTVLFVSHNMAAVSSLTSRAVLLSSGCLVLTGETDDVLAEYVDALRSSEKSLSERLDRTGTGQVRFLALEVAKEDSDNAVRSLRTFDSAVLRIHLQVNERIHGLKIALVIATASGDRLATLWSESLTSKDVVNAGIQQIECKMSNLCLMPGNYSVHAHAYVGRFASLDRVERACQLTIVPEEKKHTSQDFTNKHGSLAIDTEWQLARSQR